ncbi:acetyltransferase (GNAT) family protein [Palleronia aestuarii]|uniref:Acetyltransferase (GNAT) family protein n=1 Tax=Palleronia aestuarii TaxID=568105 RepID=A0A2W7NEK4_9RHOB|nr:GNAT family N-acetyltransferase [Palleronia aestuarii]PZX18861.1 acetyltransferase (GNAT) family protein [Palleronia aestuarii]
MSLDPSRCRPLIDATWPPAAMSTLGPWTLRDGAGGGKRVSAATTEGEVGAEDIAAAERAMQRGGQAVLFSVGAHQDDLDRLLEERGYSRLDPTRLLQCPVERLLDTAPAPGGVAVWPPLQIQLDLWRAGGVGAERIAVLERVGGPRSTFLGRVGNQPAATAFVALHENVAMLHALEVRRDLRRQGAAAALVRRAAAWSAEAGARLFTALVVEANAGANALYAGLGFTACPCYHYRIRP